LAVEVVNWLQTIVETEDLDPSLKKVIVATMHNADRVAAKE
jgi:U3 small nucleolar RNA-associated protein 6